MSSSQPRLNHLTFRHMHVVIFLVEIASAVGLIKGRCTYPFSEYHAWHGYCSELPLLNPLKMKMSILTRVTQMHLRIILSCFNAKSFQNSLSIWTHFVPQTIFLNALLESEDCSDHTIVVGYCCRVFGRCSIRWCLSYN